MDLITRLGSEDHPLYKRVREENYGRYFSFLQTMIEATVDLPHGAPWLSHEFIKAINLHAVAGLHREAGLYRTEQNVVVARDPNGVVRIAYTPPPPHRVVPLMNNLVDTVNLEWDSIGAVLAATNALWRVNSIHPFMDGNGRTARAVCYFILCVKAGGPLAGSRNLVELLAAPEHRMSYEAGLREADQGSLSSLVQLVSDLVEIQLAS